MARAPVPIGIGISSLVEHNIRAVMLCMHVVVDAQHPAAMGLELALIGCPESIAIDHHPRTVQSARDRRAVIDASSLEPGTALMEVHGNVSICQRFS